MRTAPLDPQDDRDLRVLQLFEANWNFTQIARALGITRNSVSSVIHRDKLEYPSEPLRVGMPA